MLPQGQRRRGLLFVRESTSVKNNHDNHQNHGWSRFDEATGQIYTEKTSRILSSRDRAWSRRTIVVRGRAEDEDEAEDNLDESRFKERNIHSSSESFDMRPKVRRGAHPLQSTAMEEVLRNIENITASSIEHFPLLLTQRVWETVRTRCAISFNTWVLFATYLYKEDRSTTDFLQYIETITHPQLSLESYTKPLKSASFHYITHLCITKAFPMPDLLRLSHISNLGVLEIINLGASQEAEPGPEVTDRVLRAWQFSAVSEGAFRVLRVLRLWNHEALTAKSLAYLNAFPALAVFDVQGCGICWNASSTAKIEGWMTVKEGHLTDTLESICSKQIAKLKTRKDQLTCGVTLEENERSAATLSSVFDLRWIPRKEFDNFLITHTKSENNQLHQALSKPKAQARHSWEEDSWNIFGTHQDTHYVPKHREEEVYKIYARVGQYRRDTDLSKAGVRLTDFVVQGNDVLNPLPMVSITLGRNVVTSHLHMNLYVPHLAFIRMQVPSEDNSNTQSSQDSYGPVSSQTIPPTIAPSSQRKVSSPVQRQKKRKLEDVLSSFF